MTPLHTSWPASLLSLLIVGSLCAAPTQSPPRRPALSIGYSTALHQPVGHYHQRYEPFFSQGLSLGFPTAVAPLWLVGEMRVGTLAPHHRSREGVGILHASASARYILPTPHPIKPYGSLGVNNTALHTNRQNSALDAVLIAAWENEFGVQAEAGIVLHRGPLRLNCGIVALRVLSQPYRFDTIAPTLTAALLLPSPHTPAGAR